MKKRVVIAGAGLSGLALALELAKTDKYEVIVVEKAPQAGGNTSSWTSFKDPENPGVVQYPMHMYFPFYLNLERIMEESETWDNLSQWISKWEFVDNYDKRITFGNTNLSEKLPAPLHALDIFLRLKGLSLRDKLSFTKMFFAAMAFGEDDEPNFSDRYNFYGLAKKLGVSDKGVDFVDIFTYSITNLPDSWQNGRKFLQLFYLTILKDRNAMRYSLLTDDYSPGMIEPLVSTLKDLGVQFLFQNELLDIYLDSNDAVKEIRLRDHSLERERVCKNCGLLFNDSSHTIVCPKCGINEKNLDFQYDYSPKFLATDIFVSALQPHQLIKVILKNSESPLLKHDYFRNLNYYRGSSLTVSRLWLKDKVESENVIWGQSRRISPSNGMMDISRLMPKYAQGGSVIDTLSDFDEYHKTLSDEDLKLYLQGGVKNIFPDMADVDKHIVAKIYPDALYHRPFPDMYRFKPKSQQTPINNFLIAGDWSGPYNLGMESAVVSGIKAANEIIQKDGYQIVPLLHSPPEKMVKFFQHFKFLFRKI